MQVRQLYRRTGVKLDRTERLANTLGHLLGVVDRLDSVPKSIKVRRYLPLLSTGSVAVPDRGPSKCFTEI